MPKSAPVTALPKLNDVIASWTELGHAPPMIKNGKTNKEFEITLATMTAVTDQLKKDEAHDEAHVGAHDEVHELSLLLPFNHTL